MKVEVRLRDPGSNFEAGKGKNKVKLHGSETAKVDRSDTEIDRAIRGGLIEVVRTVEEKESPKEQNKEHRGSLKT